MNNNAFLEKLLQGAKVEWKTLGEVAPPIRGKRVVRAELSENGEYPVYQNSLKPLGFYTSMNCNKYTAFIIAAGAAGEIGFSDVDFWAADDCYYFECPKDRLDSKFLYYFLLKENNKLLAQVRRASIPRLGKIAIENLKIPIPPLSVQQEIVKILDTLTALTSELTSELNLRQKQYEYYRDMLLNFKELNGGGYEVKWKTLGDVLIRTKGTQITASKMKELHKDNAPIKIFAGGKTFALVNFGDIPDKDVNTNPSIIVKSRGIIEFEYYDKPFSHKNEMWSYYSENENINLKFIFYFLKLNEPHFQRIGAKMQMPQIATPDTDKFQIPIPSIEEQKRIVEILDKFDTLANSISEGLPKEIELRNKQYEYYREMLLGFERV
ncbi:restriction endonuclease subunit S [Gallibacterium genomosp. 3]|uniref:Type I restriction modification DNA specificity domain-containing protein n=1 Tax=Gallibacterium genomosp. 3 TaxID=505345 RepID=A0A1A7PY36_9PAST|nr:restriction endonuclease subunit S [Gallibacterium genomosp. 3]OBX06070.1 hypothetical protein QV07_09170 [Gallibacterium genomosp. 3]